MYERKKPPKQLSQWSKNDCIRLKRYANFKKASQDEQQTQTKTTNINPIKNLKQHKINNKINIQVKLKFNTITLKSPEMIWDQSINSFGNN